MDGWAFPTPLIWNVPHPTSLIHQKEQGEPDQCGKHMLMSEGSYSFVAEVRVRVCPPQGVRSTRGCEPEGVPEPQENTRVQEPPPLA
jgi:hypothetical protein